MLTPRSRPFVRTYVPGTRYGTTGIRNGRVSYGKALHFFQMSFRRSALIHTRQRACAQRIAIRFTIVPLQRRPQRPSFNTFSRKSTPPICVGSISYLLCMDQVQIGVLLLYRSEEPRIFCITLIQLWREPRRALSCPTTTAVGMPRSQHFVLCRTRFHLGKAIPIKCSFVFQCNYTTLTRLIAGSSPEPKGNFW